MPETATAARAGPRPRGLTIVGWLFIAVGSIGLLVIGCRSSPRVRRSTSRI